MTTIPQNDAGWIGPNGCTISPDVLAVVHQTYLEASRDSCDACLRLMTFYTTAISAVLMGAVAIAQAWPAGGPRWVVLFGPLVGFMLLLIQGLQCITIYHRYLEDIAQVIKIEDLLGFAYKVQPSMPGLPVSLPDDKQLRVATRAKYASQYRTSEQSVKYHGRTVKYIALTTLVMLVAIAYVAVVLLYCPATAKN